MAIVAAQDQYVIGVDTHAASHSIAILKGSTTAVVAQEQFPATPAGVNRAVSWAARRAALADDVLVVAEGVGSYGAGVARAFTGAGYRVVEAQAQPAVERRGTGKSDALDAMRIARSVLGTDAEALRTPRADGIRDALRIVTASRELIVRERTATVNSLTALVRT